MNKILLALAFFGFCAAPAAAQKTVRKRPPRAAVETPAAATPETAPAAAPEKPSPNSPAPGAASETPPAPSENPATPLIILAKPRASYPSSSGCFQGRVVLRVTFRESGEIGPISVISGLCCGATDEALKAARLIRFVPATKNGRPVAVTKPVAYSFTIY